jgi:hypothetical protein
VAYLEKITEAQARETLRVLIEANQLQHVIDQDELPPEWRGPINDLPNQILENQS